MSYNKKNYYSRVIEIQNIVLAEKQKDESIYLKTIYWDLIYPKYKICYRTFQSYLGINAKSELKKLLIAEKDN